ncbi:MAG: alanine--tRNA ligase-related protein, partial [Opitutaceae bacterium]|nr:alanine--tRNA ligase-related protein [Opitutaceae bacterium]
LEQGFFAKLVPVVAAQLGHVFPELEKQKDIIQKIIKSEEDSFSRTLDRGILQFERVLGAEVRFWLTANDPLEKRKTISSGTPDSDVERFLSEDLKPARKARPLTFPGKDAFELYDTYGFPLDLTELMAKQRGITVDTAGFEVEMEKQRAKARSSQKKTDILVSDGESADATKFIGFDELEDEAEVLDILKGKDGESYLIANQSPFYAEMGGQVGDTGSALIDGQDYRILDTTKDAAGRFLHKIEGEIGDIKGKTAFLSVDEERRKAIERHHSATHILHYALREVLGTHVRQAGSYVDPSRLRFDFSHFEGIKPEQLAQIEKICNERLLENGACKWFETPFDDKPEDVIAFFGDKYGDVVRVVDIGGFSKELCGGTHVRATGEIGIIKIASESGIAAGTRRIEAIVGQTAYQHVNDIEATIAQLSKDLSVPAGKLVKKIDTLLTRNAELEKHLKRFQQKASGNLAEELLKTAQDANGIQLIKAVIDAENPNALRSLGSQIIGKLGEGLVILGANIGGKVSVVAFSSPSSIAAGHKAGDIVRDLTAKLDGRGGGKPDFAMGGGSNAEKLKEVIASLTV